MKLILTLFFSALLSVSAFAQAPSIFHYNLTNTSGSENNTQLYKAPNGGYYLVYQVLKSGPDSTMACIAYLNDGYEVQWNRMFKLMSKTTLSTLVPEAGGGISFMMNGNTSNNFYRPYWIKMSASGSVEQSIHVVDSANLNANSIISMQVRLNNGSRILYTGSSGRLMRLNANGLVDFCRYYRFMGQSNRSLFVNQTIGVPGTDTWYALGGLNGVGLAAILKFQDTTLVYSRLYNFNSPNSTNGFRSVALYPNGDLLTLISEGVSWMTLSRINPAGEVLWKKSHKVSGQSTARVSLSSNGDIWVTGALNAGQAGGLLAHFGPTGNYLGHKGQFKLGFSQQSLSGVLEEANGQLSMVNKAYYNNSNVLMVNQINQSMDFVCYVYASGPFSDTTLTLVDSVTTQLQQFVNRVGTTTNLAVPVLVSQPTLAKGPVVCATSNEETLNLPEIRIFPNPTRSEFQITGLEGDFQVILYSTLGKRYDIPSTNGKISVETLSPGLYWIEIPEINFRSSFLKL